MRNHTVIYMILAILGAGLCLAPGKAEAGVQEGLLPGVVSLDYCADQYVLQLADRPQIIAVSQEAGQAHSFYRARAAGLARFHGSIEEMLALAPDLAVRSYVSAPRMQGMSEKVGVRLLTTRYGSSLETVVHNIATVADALGQQQKAAAQIRAYKADMKRLQALPGIPLRAAYITPSGFTAGSGTFVDDIIRLAGLGSYARDKGYSGWLPLSLEDLVQDPPEVFVTSFYDTDLQTRSGWSLSRHARLGAMIDVVPTLDLPGRYMACDGLFMTRAADHIRAAAARSGLVHTVSGAAR